MSKVKKTIRTLLFPILPNVPPVFFTLLSVIFAVLSAFLLVSGRNVLASLAFLLAGIMDVLDGAVAEKFGKASMRGAALDRIVDRIVDAIGIIALALVSSRVLGLIVLSLVLIASYVSSVYEGFRRSREGEKISKRWLRIFVITVGMALGEYVPALLLLCLIALYSLATRLALVVKNL